jgi:hypothetical protein
VLCGFCQHLFQTSFTWIRDAHKVSVFPFLSQLQSASSAETYFTLHKRQSYQMYLHNQPCKMLIFWPSNHAWKSLKDEKERKERPLKVLLSAKKVKRRERRKNSFSRSTFKHKKRWKRRKRNIYEALERQHVLPSFYPSAASKLLKGLSVALFFSWCQAALIKDKRAVEYQMTVWSGR